MAALFAACQNENEPKVVSDKPGTSGDYRIIIEGEETDAQTSRSSGTIQFVGGTASGAGLYDGVGRAFVSATPDPGYEINYFYGGPDSEPKKYDNANGGATSFDVPINGQDHLFHVGFKKKTGSLRINAGTGGTVSPSGQVAIQREVPFSIKATPYSGYEFAGWTVNSGNVTIANASSTSTTATLNSASGTITANFKEIVSKNTCTITIQVPGTYVYGGQTYHLYGWDGEADIYIGGHYAGSISGPGTNSMTAAFSYTGTSVRAGASVEVSASRLTLYYSSSGGGQIPCPTMTGTGPLDSSFRATIPLVKK